MMSENGEKTVQVTAHGVCNGYPVQVAFDLPLAQVQRAVARLPRYGIQPAPADWQRTPEGAPICPKHGAVMVKREKQGDVWHSHKLIDDQGQERYCRGYRHGPADDDGYLQ